VIYRYATAIGKQKGEQRRTTILTNKTGKQTKRAWDNDDEKKKHINGEVVVAVIVVIVIVITGGRRTHATNNMHHQQFYPQQKQQEHRNNRKDADNTVASQIDRKRVVEGKEHYEWW